MKLAVLGGGFAGLAATWDLRAAGHEVTVFERDIVLGGLASGFGSNGWDWKIERAYHHLFASDDDILNFARETGYDGIFFTTPQTASLYSHHDNYRIFPLDTPQDLLKFPLLSLPERVRAGAVLAFFKFLPFFPFYEQFTAAEFLERFMGKRAWDVLFGELFRKKFGKYAEKILASFIWTRVNKRTKQLGYVRGGFQDFLDHLGRTLESKGVVINTGTAVTAMGKHAGGFTVSYEKDGKKGEDTFDRIVSTLPTPLLAKMGTDVLPKSYRERIAKIEYLNAACLIVEADGKMLEDTYWLSVCVPEFPMMVLVQHTNMIPSKHYGGKHLLYIANYVDRDHELLSMDKDQAFAYYKPYLDKLNPSFSKTVTNMFYFKAPFAQPIFDAAFIKNKPGFRTPTEGFYVANLDMTYPYDRGTNYAVKLGREVAAIAQT